MGIPLVVAKYQRCASLGGFHTIRYDIVDSECNLLYLIILLGMFYAHAWLKDRCMYRIVVLSTL